MTSSNKIQYKECRIKYVFFDVVGFTHNRSVEHQAYVIQTLNGLVRNTLRIHKIQPRNVILLPTGDGLCISLLAARAPLVHIEIALKLLQLIAKHNQKKSRPKGHMIEVRVGINENDDFILSDINGRRNVAGEGINNAQRVMNFGDGGHLIVSRSVFDSIGKRDGYKDKFVHARLKDKHGTPHDIYQFVDVNLLGINTHRPKSFSNYQSRRENIQRRVKTIYTVTEQVDLQSAFPGTWRCEFILDGRLGTDEDIIIKNKNQYYSRGTHYFDILDATSNKKGDHLKFVKHRVNRQGPDAINDLKIIKWGERYEGYENDNIPVKYYRVDTIRTKTTEDSRVVKLIAPKPELLVSEPFDRTRLFDNRYRRNALAPSFWNPSNVKAAGPLLSKYPIASQELRMNGLFSSFSATVSPNGSAFMFGMKMMNEAGSLNAHMVIGELSWVLLNSDQPDKMTLRLHDGGIIRERIIDIHPRPRFEISLFALPLKNSTVHYSELKVNGTSVHVHRTPPEFLKRFGIIASGNGGPCHMSVSEMKLLLQAKSL